MLDHRLRPLKDKLLLPIVQGLAQVMSPNGVTVGAFGLGIACALALWLGWTWVALTLWGLNRIFDGMDGLLARMTHRVSDFGGYLDIMLDFVVYAAIPAALVLRTPDLGIAWAGFALMSVFYVNAASWMYLSAILEKRGRTGQRQTTILMPTGLVEGAETIVLYTLLIMVPEWTLGLFLVGAALTFLGASVRFGWAALTLSDTNGRQS